MTTPTFTDPPTPPARTDAPATFVSRANAAWAWLVVFFAELVTGVAWIAQQALEIATHATVAEAAADAAVGNSDFMRRSSASLAVGTGAKAVTGLNSPSAADFADDDEVVLIYAEDRAIRMRGAVSSANMGAGTMTVTVGSGDFAGSGTYDNWIVMHAAFEAVDVIGRQTLWLPAAVWAPRSTNGAAQHLAELATNKIVVRGWDFDASTIEYLQATVAMPKSWDEGQITFVPVWSHGATTTNFKVSLGLAGRALSNDDALDQAMGTPQYSNDTGGTTNDLYFGPESAAITIAGTPAAEDLVLLELSRKADDGTNDTLAVDATLVGVVLYLNIDAGNDA